MDITEQALIDLQSEALTNLDVIKKLAEMMQVYQTCLVAIHNGTCIDPRRAAILVLQDGRILAEEAMRMKSKANQA